MNWDFLRHRQSPYLSVFSLMGMEIILPVSKSDARVCILRWVNLPVTNKPYIYSLETRGFYDFLKEQFIHDFPFHPGFCTLPSRLFHCNCSDLCEGLWVFLWWELRIRIRDPGTLAPRPTGLWRVRGCWDHTVISFDSHGFSLLTYCVSHSTQPLPPLSAHSCLGPCPDYRDNRMSIVLRQFIVPFKIYG